MGCWKIYGRYNNNVYRIVANAMNDTKEKWDQVEKTSAKTANKNYKKIKEEKINRMMNDIKFFSFLFDFFSERLLRTNHKKQINKPSSLIGISKLNSYKKLKHYSKYTKYKK